MPKVLRIDDDVRDVLAIAEIDGNALRLTCGELDRATYVKVDKVLKALGGTWTRGKKAHLFDRDIGDMVDQALITGQVTDEKIAFQQFVTPPEIVAQLIELAPLFDGEQMLEPSAGTGNILRAVRECDSGVQIDFCEIQECNYAALEADGFHRVGIDFLEYNPGPVYDCIIANPPFTKRQDVAHVNHMLDCLKPSGSLVTIMSPAITFADDRATTDLRARLFMCDSHSITPLPEGAFKSSGTNVRTVIVEAKG